MDRQTVLVCANGCVTGGLAAAVWCAWFAVFLARVGDEPRAVDLKWMDVMKHRITIRSD